MTLPSRHQQLHRIGLREVRAIYYQLGDAALSDHALSNGEATRRPDGTLAWLDDNSAKQTMTARHVVQEPEAEAHVTWDADDQAITCDVFGWLYQKIERYFYQRDVYVRDFYAGQQDRVGVRVITENALHTLHLLHSYPAPQRHELRQFRPDFTIIHAPNVTANPKLDGINAGAFTLTHYGKRLTLIGGSQDLALMQRAVEAAAAYHQQQAASAHYAPAASAR